MADERCWWIVKVTGYGTFPGYGTKEEAEEKRAAKAEWEGGVGRMEKADRTNRTHREMIQVENEQRRAFRARGNTGYEEDLPELTP